VVEDNVDKHHSLVPEDPRIEHVSAFWFEPKQPLIIYDKTVQGWVDTEVVRFDAPTASYEFSPSLSTTQLNRYNHAPRLLIKDIFEREVRRAMTKIQVRNSTIYDALSGELLNVHSQCVLIEFEFEVAEKLADQNYTYQPGSRRFRVSRGLVAALRDRIKTCDQLVPELCSSEGRHNGSWIPARLLLEARPAAGKSVFMKRVLCEIAKIQQPKYVPVLIPVIDLVKCLKDFDFERDILDLYFREHHSSSSDQYKMLRQALLSKRLIILIDGIDEAGEACRRQQVLKWVTHDLVATECPLVVTSRPNDMTLKRYFWYTPFHFRKQKTSDRVPSTQAPFHRDQAGEHYEIAAAASCKVQARSTATRRRFLRAS
jgi:hypothetical protein